ncbi:E3 ubiquitin-protein ligase RBBP6-like [Grus japonensis]|uniref:E3 ubiquitin-protein ligase RBBP6-like n=1 Tax=Grus japonensis TaxID=30415 RepID=A0ABC9YF51_GRUJA
MEALVKVVSQLHKQWGIDCKPKDFTLAVARLLQIGVIDQPVDILHPEVWDKCTKALAEETMSSGRGKNLKSWGKVVHALQKAIQEQETWRAAKDCLLATPKLGVGAATQTLLPPDDDDSAEPKDLQEGDTSPQFPNPDPLTEGQKRAKSFWGALAEEARSTAKKSESKEIWATPPPYAPQDGAKHKEEGRGEDAPGRNREEALKSISAHKQEGEENEKEKSGGDDRGEEGGVNEGRKPNQSGYRKKCPHRANTLPIRRWGGSRGRERSARKGSGRGQSPTKKRWNPEVTSQSSSDSGSDTMPLSKKMEKLSGVRLSPLNRTSRIKLMKTVSFCSQDRIIGHPRNPYTPVAREVDKLRCLCVILTLGLVTTGKAESNYNYHQPFKWSLLRFENHQVIATQITSGPIAMITMALIFGPCILNRLVSFVKSRLEKVNIMLVEHQQLL